VTVEGVVTVPPGAFKSSLSDEGFAIQDSSGGIYVRASTRTGLRLGGRVRVTGRLVDSNGLLTIEPSGASSVKTLGRGRVVRPAPVETGKVDERTEGLLLKVRGTVSRAVIADPPYGFRLFINDGTGEVQVYVSTSTGISQRGLETGARLEVTGFGGQYKDHYEVNPRLPVDIRPLP
jgi:DNA/RNA endonuclease YhcR with UshA esterase domain